MARRYPVIAGLLALCLAVPSLLRAGEDWFEKGLSLSRAEQYEEAEEAFSKAIEAQPDRAEAYNNRGALRYQQKDYARAVEDYSRAIALQPSADFYNNRGAAWYRLGELAKALGDFDRAVEADPMFAGGHKNRGLVLYRLEDFSGAVEAYAKAVELAPNSADLFNNRGAAHHGMGDLNRAIQDYSVALGLNRRLGDAYQNRAIAWYRKGRFDRAADDFGKALEINPAQAETYKNRGMAYFYQGLFGKALSDYIDAISIDPALVDAYNQLAWMLAVCPDAIYRNGEKALEAANKAVALVENATTLDTLAAAFAEAGKFEEAVRTQERVVALAERDASGALEAYRGRLDAYRQRKAWRSSRPIAGSEDAVLEGTITVDGGRVRSDTSLSSPILARMSRGERVSVFGKEKGWYFVEIDEDRFGWVHEVVLSVAQSSGSTGLEDEPLTVKVDVARVREAPSTDSPIAFRLKRDQTVTATRKEGPWYFLTAKDGRTGWAHESVFATRGSQLKN